MIQCSQDIWVNSKKLMENFGLILICVILLRIFVTSAIWTWVVQSLKKNIYIGYKKDYLYYLYIIKKNRT